MELTAARLKLLEMHCPETYQCYVEVKNGICSKVLNGDIIPQDHLAKHHKTPIDGLYIASEYTCGGGGDKHTCLIGKPATGCQSFGPSNCGKYCLTLVNRSAITYRVSAEMLVLLLEKAREI